jgi:hypothetical protein
VIPLPATACLCFAAPDVAVVLRSVISWAQEIIDLGAAPPTQSSAPTQGEEMTVRVSLQLRFESCRVHFSDGMALMGSFCLDTTSLQVAQELEILSEMICEAIAYRR